MALNKFVIQLHLWKSFTKKYFELLRNALFLLLFTSYQNNFNQNIILLYIPFQTGYQVIHQAIFHSHTNFYAKVTSCKQQTCPSRGYSL